MPHPGLHRNQVAHQHGSLTSPISYFLLVTLGLTAGPTFYIAIVENQPGSGGSLVLILGIAQFFISIGATLLFRIMPFSHIW
jgi:hypothetical protein